MSINTYLNRIALDLLCQVKMFRKVKKIIFSIMDICHTSFWNIMCQSQRNSSTRGKGDADPLHQSWRRQKAPNPCCRGPEVRLKSIDLLQGDMQTSRRPGGAWCGEYWNRWAEGSDCFLTFLSFPFPLEAESLLQCIQYHQKPRIRPEWERPHRGARAQLPSARIKKSSLLQIKGFRSIKELASLAWIC